MRARGGLVHLIEQCPEFVDADFMRLHSIVLGAVLAWSSLASGQVQIQVGVPLPVIRFEAPPPLVVVSPGVQVVRDYDEEVFFADGFYWVRRDSRWYRTRDHRGRWAPIESYVVPPGV